MSTGIIRLKLSLKESNNDEDKQKLWNRLHQILNDSWKAANYVASGQLMNDQLIRRIYARKKIDTKDNEQITLIEKEVFSKDGFFGTKRQATTQRDIKQVFPNIPPCITNPLNQIIYKSYIKEKKDLLIGKRSLRTYKQGMPVPIRTSSMSFKSSDDKHFFVWSLSRTEKIVFEIFYGRDRANFKSVIEKIFYGNVKIGASSIQYKKKQLYLLLTVSFDDIKKDLDPETFVGVDLGINISCYCATNNSKSRLKIGDERDLIREKTQMRNRRRRLQRNLVCAKSGHGRKRKMKALKRYQDLDRNYTNSYNHMISKRVIDFALKNNASVIKLENLKGITKGKENNVVLRNWTYFELQQMIKYKAKKNGIVIQMISPKYTSQTCSKCGNLEDGQRLSQSEFVCKKCGFKENADFNAAVNIARAIKGKENKIKKIKKKEVVETCWN